MFLIASIELYYLWANKFVSPAEKIIEEVNSPVRLYLLSCKRKHPDLQQPLHRNHT